jgi:probable rRNA maturation factor
VPGGRARLARDLARVAALAARRAGRPVTLSVAVLGDPAIRAINRARLAHDYPADVLSFALEDGRDGLLGALALGGDVARREAASRGHSAYHELLLYAVHGTLHLLGHDDHAPRARARMRRAERAWLAALGVGPVFRSRRTS